MRFFIGKITEGQKNMVYRILVADDVDFKSIVVDAIKTKKTIDTWEVNETVKGEKVFVHTAKQWIEKGFIRLELCYNDECGRYFKASFAYWKGATDKNENDFAYLLGRFTELLLVHFQNVINAILIDF